MNHLGAHHHREVFGNLRMKRRDGHVMETRAEVKDLGEWRSQWAMLAAADWDELHWCLEAECRRRLKQMNVREKGHETGHSNLHGVVPGQEESVLQH